MINVDGSYGLGSGQLVRYALSFSALSRKPIHITNIRSSRPSPGLKAQHLTAVKVLKKMCDASAPGIKIGSREIRFMPGELIGGNIKEDIGTAGSITLLIQNIIYPAMFAKEKTILEIKGGTDVNFSPTIDYTKEIFLPFIKKFVKNIDLEIIKRGFYPKGGGKVKLTVKPKYSVSEFQNFNKFLDYLKEKECKINLTERGILKAINGICLASDTLQKADVVRRQCHGAVRGIGLGRNIQWLQKKYVKSFSSGSTITLFSEFEKTIIGTDKLGAIGKKAEVVGEECAKELDYELKSIGCVDTNMVDNLIPLLGMLGGKILTSNINDHAKTAMWVTEKFLNKTFVYDHTLISIK